MDIRQHIRYFVSMVDLSVEERERVIDMACHEYDPEIHDDYGLIDLIEAVL